MTAAVPEGHLIFRFKLGWFKWLASGTSSEFGSWGLTVGCCFGARLDGKSSERTGVIVNCCTGAGLN